MRQAKYQTVIGVARRLGVPVRWLQREVEAGRVPAIHAGRRVLMDPEAVEAALIERARKATGKGAGDE